MKLLAKKGIAIPYIIALILGIVVVGVIGYWFFTTTGTGSGSAVVSQCNAKKTQWCTDWSRTAFDNARKPGNWESFAPGCSNVGVAEPGSLECRTLTGLLKVTGAECLVGFECQSGACNPTTRCKTGAYDSTGTNAGKCAECNTRDGYTYDGTTKDKCVKSGAADQEATLSDSIKVCG